MLPKNETELCKHMRDPRDCEVCDEEQTCHHGVRVDQIECEACMEEEDGDILGTGEDDECEHGLPESDCHQCGAETDRLIERANAQRDWNHWHPADGDE